MMQPLERFLAGCAILISAATVAAAFLFRFDGAWSGFQRMSQSLGFVFGYWVIAAVVAGLIWLGAQVLKLRAPIIELFFVLVCGGCAVAILEAFR